MAETQAKEEHVHHLKSRYDTLKSATERSNFETQWQQIGEVVSPRKIDFVGIRTPGEKRMSQVYDPTGKIAYQKTGTVTRELLGRIVKGEKVL